MWRFFSRPTSEILDDSNPPRDGVGVPPRNLPRDEFAERTRRQQALRLRELALQHLEWAHERTQAAMDAARHDEADVHSSTVAMWIDRIEDLR